MWLTILNLLLTLGISGGLYTMVIFLNDWVSKVWHFIWIPILALPLIYCLLFLLYLITIIILSLFLKKGKESEKYHRGYNYYLYLAIHQFFLIFRVFTKKVDFDKIDSKKKYLIIYNHSSNYDPILIMDKLHHLEVCCITKPENKNIVFIGKLLDKIGYISIDREDDRKALRAIKKAINFAERDNCSICVAPEGTRSKSGKLLPFKPGCFKVATRAQLDILVIGFKNANAIHSRIPFRSTKVEMKVLDIITTSDYEGLSTVEISDRCRKLYIDYLGANEVEEVPEDIPATL